MNTTKTNKSST